MGIYKRNRDRREEQEIEKTKFSWKFSPLYIDVGVLSGID